MKNTPTKVDGVDTVSAAEVNSGMSNEPKNFVTSTGQTLTSPDQKVEDTNPFQESIAAATYAGVSQFYTCSGTVNNYVLTPMGALKAPFVYREGMRIRFVPNISNTGAAQVNVDTKGPKPVKKNNGSADLDANDLSAGTHVEATYVESGGGYFELHHEKTSLPYPATGISGFQISQDSGDENHYTTIGEGSARSLDAQVNLTIPTQTEITKYTNAPWADGTHVGGMAAGLTLAANTTYHNHLLGKDDGTTNWGFDTSITAANLLADANVIAAGYKHYRYAASIMTDGSSNTYPYTCLLYNGQIYIYWKTLIVDYLASNPGISPVLAAIRVPLGVDVDARIVLFGVGPPFFLGFCYAPDVTLSSAGPNFASDELGIAEINTSTNFASQVQYQISVSGPGTSLQITTKGFKINR